MRAKLLPWMVLVLALGCGGGRPAGAAEAGGDEGATEGGDTSQYQGPITSTEIERGKEIFDARCGDCHPNGEEDVGPSLVAEPHTPARIRQQIREGARRMRPFSEKRLSAVDMEAVLAYLASIHAVK